MSELFNFISSPEWKFAVITRASFDTDPIAQKLSTSPAIITKDGVELVILSIPTDRVAELAAYAEQAANGVEFELTLGTGKVTLLTHQLALKLVAEQQPESNLI